MRLATARDLAAASARLAEEFHQPGPFPAEWTGHPIAGPSLRHHLLLTECPDALANLGLSEAERFWSRYYWLARFAREWQALVAPDASLQQQVIRLLESADALGVSYEPLLQVERAVDKTAQTVAETDPVRARIRAAIRVDEFYLPPTGPNGQPRELAEMIAEAEELLGVPMPAWLRAVYLACNGFAGPTNECYLYTLHGSEGTVEFTDFLRQERWAPAWLSRAIVFGYTGGSGSGTRHTVALDGKLGEWCYGDGDQFTVLDGDLYAVWADIQTRWDEVVCHLDWA